jgi:hypothetical protein
MTKMKSYLKNHQALLTEQTHPLKFPSLDLRVLRAGYYSEGSNHCKASAILGHQD